MIRHSFRSSVSRSSWHRGPTKGIGRESGMLSVSPCCNRRSSMPASILPAKENGGVFTSPRNHTSGFSGDTSESMSYLTYPQVGNGNSSRACRCIGQRFFDVVVKLHHAIRKPFHGTQFQRHLAMPGRDEWNAFADEDGYDADDEFVDGAFVQKRRDEPPASHQPDVLARLLAEAFGKRANRLRDEFDTGGHGCGRRRSGEHVVRIVRIEVCAHL